MKVEKIQGRRRTFAGNSQPGSLSLTDEVITELSLHELDPSGWQIHKLCSTFYRLQRTNKKSVNWERSCWERSATWRRKRRKPWGLQPPAQPTTFKTCRTSFLVRKKSSSIMFWEIAVANNSIPQHTKLLVHSFKQLLFSYFPLCAFDSHNVFFLSGLQKRLTALPPTLRSMKTDYTSLRSQVRNFSDFYGAAISEAKKQVSAGSRILMPTQCTLVSDKSNRFNTTSE